MASWIDDWAEGLDDYFVPKTPDYEDLVFGNESQVDSHAQELMKDAYFNGNEDAYVDLVEYMWDEYGLDWEDVFDWEDFREWYDAQ